MITKILLSKLSSTDWWCLQQSAMHTYYNSNIYKMDRRKAKNMLMKNQSGVTGIELSPSLRVINQASLLLLWFVAASTPVQSAGPPVAISLISSSVPRTLIVRTFGFDWFLQMAPFRDYALFSGDTLLPTAIRCYTYGFI